jgi:hypothetical protein
VHVVSSLASWPHVGSVQLANQSHVVLVCANSVYNQHIPAPACFACFAKSQAMYTTRCASGTCEEQDHLRM